MNSPPAAVPVSPGDVNRLSVRLAAITLNVICITYYNIMPLVIGGAAETRQLAPEQLGFAASAFMAGLALVNFCGFAWLRRCNWKLLVLGGHLVATLAFTVPVVTFTAGLWASANFIAGIATGVSYGVSIACLGDSREPERNFALAYAGQTFLSAGLIFMLPRLDMGHDLFERGQLVAAALMAGGILLVLVLPAAGAKTGLSATIPKGRHASFLQAALLMGLLLLMLNLVAEGAIWAFVERIAVAGGMTTTFAATVMAFSFFASGAGSMIAATIGTRYGNATPFMCAVTMSIGSVWILWYGGGQAPFFAGVMLFAMAWNLGSPYRMALATRADVSGRYSTLIPAMQTLGAALGPALAGILIVGDSFLAVYVMCTVAWLATIVLFFAAGRRLRYAADAVR